MTGLNEHIFSVEYLAFLLHYFKDMAKRASIATLLLTRPAAIVLFFIHAEHDTCRSPLRYSQETLRAMQRLLEIFRRATVSPSAAKNPLTAGASERQGWRYEDASTQAEVRKLAWQRVFVVSGEWKRQEGVGRVEK